MASDWASASHRASVVDPIPLGALLRAIDSFDRRPTTRAALRLAPYVFVRPGELRYADRKELDRYAAVWSIPVVKMKIRRPHRVPLMRQALVVLRDLQEVNEQAVTGYSRRSAHSPVQFQRTS